MAYVIKWVVEEGTTAAPPVMFSTLAEAMDTACAALALRPQDLWVEDEHGWHVADMARIIRYRQRAGRRGADADP